MTDDSEYWFHRIGDPIIVLNRRNLIHPVIVVTYQAVIEREYTHVPAVVDVIPAHDRIGVVLHPDAGEGVPADLVILVRTLGVIRHVKSDVLAIRYITMSDYRIRADTTHTNSGTNCNKKNIMKSRRTLSLQPFDILSLKPLLACRAVGLAPPRLGSIWLLTEERETYRTGQ